MFCMESVRMFFFSLEASSKHCIRCMIDGAKEKVYTVLAEIGDIMMVQSSGGNSTAASLLTGEKNSGKIRVKLRRKNIYS